MTTATHQHTIYHAETYDRTAKPPSPSSKSALIPILLTCLAYMLFTLGDACIKYLADKYHFSQIMALHCVVIIACICGYGFFREGKKAFVIRNKKLVSLRAALSVVVGILNIYAFPHIELTTFYTLVFTSPFWVTILSSIFLGEKISKSQMGVIAAGFAVILFVFQPGSGALNLWSAFVLTGAFLYAASMVVMRKMGPGESRTMIITAGSAMTLAVVLPLLPFHYVTPSLFDLAVFLMMGIISSIGLTAIAYAFQTAPSVGSVAPYHYTQIFWGTVLGYFVFSETPEVRVLIGASFIIAAGLYLIYGEAAESRRARKRAKAIATAEMAA